jgi:hypothetical protein
VCKKSEGATVSLTTRTFQQSFVVSKYDGVDEVFKLDFDSDTMESIGVGISSSSSGKNRLTVCAFELSLWGSHSIELTRMSMEFRQVGWGGYVGVADKHVNMYA